LRYGKEKVMKFSPREVVLAAYRELEAERESKKSGTTRGEYFAHLDVQISVTYMGRLPIDYGAECYVSTDEPTRLIPAVREAFEKIAGAEDVFSAIDHECKKLNTEEGTEHGESRPDGEEIHDADEEEDSDDETHDYI
jgi:hypothetical protein